MKATTEMAKEEGNLCLRDADKRRREIHGAQPVKLDALAKATTATKATEVEPAPVKPGQPPS